MSFENYTALQAEVLDWSYRTDISARIPSFIRLCESDMQVRCKLVEFEADGTVSIVAGVGTLPTGFTGARVIYWDGDRNRSLSYVTPDRFATLENTGGTGLFYTITGTTLKVSPGGDGTVSMTYKARFTPLSDASPNNVLLDNYPDAYLRGSLLQFAMWAQDKERAADEAALFEAAIERIVIDNAAKKWAGPQQVRPR